MHQPSRSLLVSLTLTVAALSACGTELDVDQGAAAVDADAADGAVHDHVEEEGEEAHHGLPTPEPLEALPELDEHALAEDPISDSDLEAEEQGVQILAVPSNCEKIKVVRTGGTTLRIRPTASTSRAAIGALDPGQTTAVLDAVSGESVNGVTRWYKVRDDGVTGFVSGAFTSCIDVPSSTTAATRFKLPLRCGKSARVTQGNNSSFSHNGRSRYAFDFGLPRGTPLVAIASGRVVGRRGSTRPGDACWSGGGQSCADKANYVVLQHDDGTQSVYAHLDSPSVAMGERVVRGQQVGLSGGTGWSTGPHAHIARQQNCGYTFCQSVETRFADVSVNGGIPRAGDTVTSGNCN